MLKAALAFFPLIAGYLFVTTWHKTRYLIKREDSQKIYIRAAFWGIWLFLLAFTFVTSIKQDVEPYLAFVRVWADLAILQDSSDRQIDTAFWVLVLFSTLALGMFGGYLLNWSLAFGTISRKEFFRLLVRRVKHRDPHFFRQIYDYSTRAALKKVIHDLNADLEIIVMRALELTMPVSVTMGNGKVYIGYVTGAIDPGDKRDMLRILPVVSGYRAGEEMTLRFTTWYTTVYQRFKKDESLSHLNPELFEVAFPLSEIRAINLFDAEAYQAFQQENAPAVRIYLPDP
ncbi:MULTISPECIES: hypothetical protein [Gammaproteobacteria]|uniref:hypothetical protein n=1 Tax=Gammaproteobacteria TaxID=1236 RepID=UPI001914895E|nr:MULTISPECIES: hypothetical protein [Gammaproteobacteria]MBK5299709.1 hypothetical protein [Bacillus sp. TH86]MBK5319478.1 hypothetical protein [Bacillus sp. TH59]MBK5334428.1 hypothetical protein [Bacillus sp. TH57]MBK5308518.1 hypothetical protein [Pseudomonas sp. TH71]MBK5313977.1 hypothetical protein [Erwinia sp. TH79]